MTLSPFENAVKEMRIAQKQFFEAAHGSMPKRLAFQLSRKWERVVDDYLKTKEPNLFDEADHNLPIDTRHMPPAYQSALNAPDAPGADDHPSEREADNEQ